MAGGWLGWLGIALLFVGGVLTGYWSFAGWIVGIMLSIVGVIFIVTGFSPTSASHEAAGRIEPSQKADREPTMQ